MYIYIYIYMLCVCMCVCPVARGVPQSKSVFGLSDPLLDLLALARARVGVQSALSALKFAAGDGWIRCPRQLRLSGVNQRACARGPSTMAFLIKGSAEVE